MLFFTRVTGPVAKLAFATAIAYAMLIITIRYLSWVARRILAVCNDFADWIKASIDASDDVMIIVDLLIDGKIFMIIPYLLVARILIELVPLLARKIPIYRVITGTIGIALIVGLAYSLTT